MTTTTIIGLKHRDLQVYWYFDEDTIRRIVEWYCSGGETHVLPSTIFKNKVIEALIDWLDENCYYDNFGARIGDCVEDLIKNTNPERLENVLEMKKACHMLESLIQYDNITEEEFNSLSAGMQESIKEDQNQNE
tara:strand:+ start:243 stop:644 length:402 start_codon:yes stop_codon:yes gene_type:complete